MTVRDVIITLVMLYFILSCIYHVKHYVADFLLQGKYMIGKFKPGWGWVIPLAAHCGVHLLFTLAITLVFAPRLWWLCIFDFVIHFIMDRIKASPNLLGQYKALSANEYVALMTPPDSTCEPGPIAAAQLEDRKQKALKSNTYFWWALGFDQMIHALTHEVIILCIMIYNVLPFIQ